MKVSIKVEGINKAKIYIDDKEIKKVTKINFNTAVGEVPTVSLELIPSEINIEANEALVIKEKQFENYSVEELMDVIAEKCIYKVFENNK